MQSSSKKIIVIAGPTAVGKTSVAIEVAKKLHSCILSADSRQCFSELKIGVARPSEEELALAPHYFVASHSVQQKIDAAFYEAYALNLLKELFRRYDTVVVSGGTGLYIKALVEGLDEIPEVPAEIREKIIQNYRANGIDWLQKELQLKDTKFASQGEMKNPQRMMRALEVMQATGRSILSFRSGAKALRDFAVIQTALEMPREILNASINRRVDSMIAQGLEAEVRSLLPYRNLNALQTVGYKEMFDYLDGVISLPDAIGRIKQNTRRYAKRQITWFKKQQDIQWFDASANNTEQLAGLIADAAG